MPVTKDFQKAQQERSHSSKVGQSCYGLSQNRNTSLNLLGTGFHTSKMQITTQLILSIRRVKMEAFLG
ncbi:hypothetical protein A6R68_16287 [Neotoma lepida]|uniref:Uncharacterized protein n=1 Tax=Neotoma lepida TaxID=56216 RepID=A0A1A6HG91_NEOLE|nr:hypothetical protein A6R68_16287 [Neotoma lepida]